MFLLDLCCGLKKNAFEFIVSLENCDNRQDVINRQVNKRGQKG